MYDESNASLVSAFSANESRIDVVLIVNKQFVIIIIGMCQSLNLNLNVVGIWQFLANLKSDGFTESFELVQIYLSLHKALIHK